MPREVIERKILTYLRQSASLERYRNVRISAESFSRELNRIAGNTRLPEGLAEIYEALGNDSALIQETLARASLGDRLSHTLFMPQDVDQADLAPPLDVERVVARTMPMLPTPPQRAGASAESVSRTAAGSQSPGLVVF